MEIVIEDAITGKPIKFTQFTDGMVMLFLSKHLHRTTDGGVIVTIAIEELFEVVKAIKGLLAED